MRDAAAILNLSSPFRADGAEFGLVFYFQDGGLRERSVCQKGLLYFAKRNETKRNETKRNETNKPELK